MSNKSWYASVLAAVAPTSRFETLFSMSDSQLAARGFDREGLQRNFITGLASY